MSADRESGEKLSHFDAAGNASMVDVGGKAATAREAVAAGEVVMSAAAYRLLKAGAVGKGDVLGVARIAGIMAAKKVDELIPLTHTLSVEKVEIAYQLHDSSRTVGIEAMVKSTGRTGVEMEALTAVSVTALTIYDMCKAVDKGMVIDNIRLLRKTGGKRGTYVRDKE